MAKLLLLCCSLFLLLLIGCSDFPDIDPEQLDIETEALKQWIVIPDDSILLFRDDNGLEKTYLAHNYYEYYDGDDYWDDNGNSYGNYSEEILYSSETNNHRIAVAATGFEYAQESGFTLTFSEMSNHVYKKTFFDFDDVHRSQNVILYDSITLHEQTFYEVMQVSFINKKTAEIKVVYFSKGVGLIATEEFDSIISVLVK